MQDLIFAAVALREGIISAEAIDHAWAILEEMATHGIKCTLASILVDREFVDSDRARIVSKRVERLQVKCARCRGGLPIKDIIREGRTQCERCDSTVELVLSDDVESADLPIEQRLGTVVLRKASPDGSHTREDARPDGHAPDPSRHAVDTEPARTRRSARDEITRFRISSVVHSGPFGRLYRATVSKGDDSSPVALKVLSDEVIKDPKSPARLAAALSDWNSVTDSTFRVTHSVLQENDLVHVVRAEFEEPFAALSDLRPTGMDEREAILRRITVLLAELHGEGRVHGNIKPSNFIVKADDLEYAFLVDPCLDALLPTDNNISRWNLLLRGPRYLAPEVIDGGSTSQKSDVCSLGWTFHALLSGTSPFTGIPAPEVLRRHREGPFPELSGAAKRWRTLVTQMTAVTPDERPASATEVLEHVDAILAGQTYRSAPVTARVTSRQDEGLAGSRSRTRFPLRYAVGPACLLAVLAWVGWCLVGWHGAASRQESPGRARELLDGLAEHVFDETRGEARAHPESGRELWEEFISTFSATPMVVHAEAEKRDYPTAAVDPREASRAASGARPERRR